MNLIDWLHMLFVVYFMLGGMICNPDIYSKIASLTLFGWILFGNCILNLNRNFPKGSILRQFSKEMNLNDEYIVNTFMLFILLSILLASYKTKSYGTLYILVMYFITRSSVVSNMIYKDSKTYTT